jgi:hypothetical protein
MEFRLHRQRAFVALRGEPADRLAGEERARSSTRAAQAIVEKRDLP